MSDTRKKLRLGGGLNGSRSDDGFTRRWSTHVDFIYRPSNSLSFSVQPFFTVNHDDFQYRGTEEIDNTKHYILARLKQKTASYIVRIDYTITPDLSSIMVHHLSHQVNILILKTYARREPAGRQTDLICSKVTEK